jgi:hypothetical protein
VILAFLLDVGESLLSAIDRPPEWWIVESDILRPDRPIETFYADVPAEDVAVAVERVRPSSYAAVAERLTAPAWRDIPSTYVICLHDQAIPLPAQEQMAKRATHVR